MDKDTLWLMVADRSQEGLALAIPTVAWMAEQAGAAFETYIESHRSGKLFAKTGSTVLGGRHYNDFNYLNNLYDVKFIFFGQVLLFRSSLQTFGAQVLAEAQDLVSLYHFLQETMAAQENPSNDILVLPHEAFMDGYDIGPYIYADIFNRKALAITIKELDRLQEHFSPVSVSAAYLPGEELDNLAIRYPNLQVVDRIEDDDTIGALTTRIARRWKSWARGVSFGDPEIMYFLLATNCRERRVSLFAPQERLHPAQIRVSAYTEEHTGVADEVIRLCGDIGNDVIMGRQTCDGDLIYWGGAGICMQIMDPNRPVFPIFSRKPQPWPLITSPSVYMREPDEETLRAWAQEGKVLTSLLWHSGEVAHTEAMLNVIEFGIFTGLKMGIGVHAQRYQTSPQLWELSAIPYEKGGALGLVESLIYSGGMGIMGERFCPPEKVRTHCENALSIIEGICGREHLPRGYYAFYDSDMDSFTETHPELYRQIGMAGLDYIVTTAWPGRNRVSYADRDTITINQTPRTIFTGSPFVRANIVEMMRHCTPLTSPGWLLAAIDSPVHAFAPYIWQKGHHMMDIAEFLMNSPGFINVTPHTIARYARLLLAEGYLPSDNEPRFEQ